MHNIKKIRENPLDFDIGLELRGYEPISADILKIDDQTRSLQTKLQALQKKRNEISKTIGQVKLQGDHTKLDQLLNNVANLKDTIQQIQEDERKLKDNFAVRRQNTQRSCDGKE